MIGKVADSRSLLGNPARFSVPALDLDAVFAGTVPTEPPYPFPPVARKLSNVEKKANAQAEQDFEVVRAVADYTAEHEAEPDAEVLQAIADKYKVAFIYHLDTYEPGEKKKDAETKTTANPAALLGNPARTAPAPGKSSSVPLDLDAAQAAGFPSAIPYPWPESAQLTDEVKILSNEQAGLDFGVVTYLVNWKESNPDRVPTTDNLQGMANKSGVIFSYTIEGEKAPVIYTPGKYFPGE